MEIAVAAVGLLAPYLKQAGEAAAGRAGEAATAGVQKLLAFLRNKLGDDQQAEEALTELEKQPEDTGHQNELIRVLDKRATNDPDFGDELKRLIDEATGTLSVAEFNTVNYGTIGNLVQAQQVENLNFN